MIVSVELQDPAKEGCEVPAEWAQPGSETSQESKLCAEVRVSMDASGWESWGTTTMEAPRSKRWAKPG